MVLGTLQNGPSTFMDGVALWIKLIALAVMGGASWVGYKINQELFKTGGVVERLNELDKNQVSNASDLDDHERRIGKLEDWKDRRSRQ